MSDLSVQSANRKIGPIKGGK